jgi:hypothetical protein
MKIFLITYTIGAVLAVICALWETRDCVTCNDHLQADEFHIHTWLIGACFMGLIWPIYLVIIQLYVYISVLSRR